MYGHCCDTPLVYSILILKFASFQAPVKKPEEKDPIFEEDEMERVCSNLLCLQDSQRPFSGKIFLKRV